MPGTPDPLIKTLIHLPLRLLEFPHMEVSVLTDPGPQIGRRQHLKVMNDGWTHRVRFLPITPFCAERLR